MPVIALNPDYRGDVADAEERFHGQRLLYIGWDDHLMFCSPVCVPVSADMRFGALVDQLLPGLYGSHPDFAAIDWRRVQWRHGRDAFVPDMARSLADNGLVHKSFLTLSTPGFTGLGGSHN
jgi:phenol hydroxylase P4 protein